MKYIVHTACHLEANGTQLQYRPESEQTAGTELEQGEAESEGQEGEDVEEGVNTLEEAVRHELKEETTGYINTLEEAVRHELKE